MKASVYHYQDKKSKFLKIYCALPSHIAHVRSLFEKGIVKLEDKRIGFAETTFESNMVYNLRFMIDNNINGM